MDKKHTIKAKAKVLFTIQTARGGHMLLPKNISKSTKYSKRTRFKAMALPPAGDELLGNLKS